MNNNSIQTYNNQPPYGVKSSQQQNFGSGTISKLAAKTKDSFVKSDAPEAQDKDLQSKRKKQG